MGMIIYGTRYFTKLAGYYGEKEECSNCHKTYKKAYVKYTKWAHLNYLPIFPMKTTYFKMCPICARGVELKNKEGKAEIQNSNDTNEQRLEYYAKHILINKPKNIFDADISYEFWVKDLDTGEEICVASSLSKDSVKDMKKDRGISKLRIEDV